LVRGLNTQEGRARWGSVWHRTAGQRVAQDGRAGQAGRARGKVRPN
jgi:hypothetical protein